MEKEKLMRLLELKNEMKTEDEDENKKPRLTKEQLSFAEELYKAYFTAQEAATMLHFGYGCLASHWKQFRYAKVKKYDRWELIVRRNHTND